MQKAEERQTETNTSKEEQEEINDLEREAEGLDNRIDTHKKRLKDIIKRLAELYEKKLIREGRSDEIRTICTIICKRFPDNKHIRSYARRHLDKKYLMWTYEKKYEGFTENSNHNKSVDLSTLDPTSEEYKVQLDEAVQAFETIKNLPKNLDKSQDLKEIRHNADICYQYIRKCEDLAEATGQDLIPAQKRYGASKILHERLNKDNEDKNRISLVPVGKGTGGDPRLLKIFKDKMFEWIEKLSKYEKDVEEHTPSDETLERIIFGIEREIKLLEWITDDRRSMDPQEWMRFIEKHYGVKDSLKSTIEVRQPEYTINRDTGKVECKNPFRSEQVINISFEDKDVSDKQVQTDWKETIMVKKFNDCDYIIRTDDFKRAVCAGYREVKRKGAIERKNTMKRLERAGRLAKSRKH